MKTTAKLSFTGLNAANFFQAEMVGVILPVLNVFLKNAGWHYDALGLATAVAGLGGVLFQGFAGWLTDRVPRRRLLFARGRSRANRGTLQALQTIPSGRGPRKLRIPRTTTYFPMPLCSTT